MAYLLDSNVFIQAKNLHYGLDFCPAFWKWLTVSNAAGTVFSIEKVGDELADGSDELATWAAPLGSGGSGPSKGPSKIETPIQGCRVGPWCVATRRPARALRGRSRPTHAVQFQRVEVPSR